MFFFFLGTKFSSPFYKFFLILNLGPAISVRGGGGGGILVSKGGGGGGRNSNLKFTKGEFESVEGRLFYVGWLSMNY